MLTTRPAHAIPLRLLGFSAMFVAAALTNCAGQTAPAKPAAAQPKPQVTPVQERPRLLVFSKTAGFRHQSIPDGIKAIRALLSDRYEIDATEDAAVFSADNLKRYRALVFMSTTGDILNDAQQAALEGYIHAGGGYAGVHSAADTEHTWPWYGELVGAYFKTHPAIQDAMVRVEDQTHRSTRMLPAQWPRHDEWYVYTSNPRSRVKVLANLDDSTITGANMDGDHPIAWYHEFQGGRAWYTGGGHTSESYAEPLFLKHIEGGILWAAGASDDAVAPTKKVDAKQP